jgi:hypothetical protein
MGRALDWPGGISILMFSYRRLVLLLVLGAFASHGVRAQSSSSQPEQAPTPTPAPTAAPTSGALSVQARLRARREARRVAAIHDVYSHLYEAYVGGGYLRFHPGDGTAPENGQPQTGLQRINEFSWDVGVTRYFNEKLGVTVDGRGIYGVAFLGLNSTLNSAITKPKISQYTAMVGPTYRFILHPKYSVSGRVLAGGAWGKFSNDLGSFTPAQAGLYPDGASLAINASVPVEYNFSPTVGLRVAPEYLLTNFGSTTQNSLGFTAGVVVRWGKQ